MFVKKGKTGGMMKFSFFANCESIPDKLVLILYMI